MKLNFGLLGIALAQSGDDYSDERHDYSYDYNNVGNHHHYSGFGGDQSYSFNDFGAKAFPDDILAIQLSCWNSNSLRDMNHDGKFYDTQSFDGSSGTHSAGSEYHHYNHQYGFENAYNAISSNAESGASVVQSHALADFGDNIDSERDIDVSDDKHSVMAIDPKKWGYQSDNPDAKYHYGHHIEDADLSSNKNRPHSSQIDEDKATFDGVIDDWRYSLRHSGCLYEAPDYFYGATTFNAQRFLTYGLTDGTTTVTKDTNVHWVHVFNAHIHIDQGVTTGSCRSAGDHPLTEQSCLNDDSIHQFAVVMANPTYEGLGFINFVVSSNITL